MPWTKEQRAAKLAAESPAQREARRAKERARYRAKKAKKQKPASNTVRAIFSRARSNGVLDAPPPPPPSPMIAMVDAALAADAPDVGTLAQRQNYAEAADLLSERLGWQRGPQSPASILWTRDADLIVSFRLAYGLAVFEPSPHDHTRRDREWLRSVDSEAARVALALLGECSWQDATPRERAGYLLGRAVEARRAVS